jgi:DNA-binding NarL/FixJ family response regulator
MAGDTAERDVQQARIQQSAIESDAASTWIARFTERELDILQLMSQGATNTEIGTELFISRYTVAQHVAAMLRKTECRTRAHLVYWAVVSKVIE